MPEQQPTQGQRLVEQVYELMLEGRALLFGDVQHFRVWGQPGEFLSFRVGIPPELYALDQGAERYAAPYSPCRSQGGPCCTPSSTRSSFFLLLFFGE